MELLKIDGWDFIQLSGPYRVYENHADAFPNFAERVEEFIERDIQTYVTEIVGKKEKKEPSEEKQKD